ncbi:conjugal transfer protein TrbE [Atlantibacter subterraneus]|uniref:conjugal transfer protein TrbE n=1 Tax=Atlantibacter subterraneus TaxID=255519 RepID=UPI002FDD23DA
MKSKGFLIRFIVSLIALSPVLYWCRNIVSETSLSDVLTLFMLITGVLIALLLAWSAGNFLKK